MIGFFFGIKENRLENCLSLSSVKLADGFEREETAVGPAVSSLPKGGMAAYILENNAALETGFGSVDEGSGVALYPSAEAMSGNTLEDLLGEGWLYAENALPIPQ